MRPVIFSRTLANAVVGAICASQTPGGAGNLLINGTLASGGVATMAAQQIIGITSAANLSGITFTITGTDDAGRTISEVLTGPNIATVQSVFNYRTVTRIAVSGAAAGALTVDTLQTGASLEVVVDRYISPTSISIGVEVTGVINYSIQWTLDDVFGGAPGPFSWFAGAANLTNATTTQAGSIVSPVSAIRIVNNSGAGTAKLIVQQAGLV